MEDVISVSQPNKDKLPPLEQAAEWPRQAVRERNWLEAAQRWAVLRKAYPQHPVAWLQGAKAHIEAGELKQAEILLEHGREHFPNNPNAFTITAELAMKQQQWDVAKTYLQHSRERFPDFAQTWMTSAEYAEHKGNLDTAVEYNEKARQCAPELITPFVQYAELAMRAKQWEQALARWKLLRTHFSDAPIGYNRAAEAARQLGKQHIARQLMLSLEYGENLFEDKSLTANAPPRVKGNTNPASHLLELIWTKAIFNLRSEVHRNYLSYGWWVLEPLLHMTVYYLVFGLLMHRGDDNFLAFLLSGLIPWMWFTKAVSGSSNSILAGQNLMLQVGLPSIVFPLIDLLKASLQQVPVFLLLLGFVWLQGFEPNILWLLLLPVIIVQAVFTTAFSCTVAAVIPFARDLSYLVPTGLMFLMFVSGIFYDYRTLSAEWQSLFLLNPLAFLLKCYREILIDGVVPALLTLTWWGLGSAIACIFLVLAYMRLRYIYPRIVVE